MKREHVCVGGFLSIYFVVFGYTALHRVFSFDEIFTAYLAALPSASGLLKALQAGADLAPPLFHLVTRVFAAVPGGPHLALRLPGLLGFGVMCACIFVFVNRRCGMACAAISMLAPVATASTRYAVEARPYGLVLGCFGVALLCWQAAADGRRRTASLAGLGLAVAAAVSLHYYAILILVPIGAGELARLVRTRRVDAGVWIAVATGAAALLAHLPLMPLSKPYMHNAWAAPALPALAACFAVVTSPLLLVSFLPAAARALRWRVRRRDRVARDAGIPAHEWAAAASLATLPLLVYLVGITFTGIFVGRYALGATIGFAILLGFVLHTLPDARPATAALLIVPLCAAAVVYRIGSLTARGEDVGGVLSRRAGAASVISGNAFRFLYLSYYAPSMRLRYIADPEEARRRTGSNSTDLGLLALRPWAPVTVEEYASFARRREPFLLYWRPEEFSWLLPKLRDSGASIRLVDQASDDQLYSVEWP